MRSRAWAIKPGADHDYIGDFYNRNITHANMGYTFKAADSGLAMKIDWPSSDLEMMEPPWTTTSTAESLSTLTT